jgi:hypothetical protein
MSTLSNNNLYTKIADLLLLAMIVEDEQQGKERSEYGKQVLRDVE